MNGKNNVTATWPDDATVVIVPGLNNSGPQHWQSRWEHYLPKVSRVRQDNWMQPQRKDWVQQLEKHMSALEGPLVLVGHSLGCITIAHWAQTHDVSKVKAALLVAPADVERPSASVWLRDFAPLPLRPLPFASHVVASDDDPYCLPYRSLIFAGAWNSDITLLNNAGHINADSGLGLWEEGLEYLAMLGENRPHLFAGLSLSSWQENKAVA